MTMPVHSQLAEQPIGIRLWHILQFALYVADNLVLSVNTRFITSIREVPPHVSPSRAPEPPIFFDPFELGMDTLSS